MIDLDELEKHLNEVELLGSSDLTTDMVLALIERVRELEDERADAVDCGAEYVSKYINAKAVIFERDTRIKELEARNAELVEALKPFADWGNRFGHGNHDEWQLAPHSHRSQGMTVGHLRAAARAIGEVEHE